MDQLCWHQTHCDLLSTASGDKTVRLWDTRMNKSVAIIPTKGENINITWSPNGDTIAVGNKEDLVTFIDARTYKIKAEEQYHFEVNEISWNNTSDLFFLTNGQGCIHILRYYYGAMRKKFRFIYYIFQLSRFRVTKCYESTSWYMYLYRV